MNSTHMPLRSLALTLCLSASCAFAAEWSGTMSCGELQNSPNAKSKEPFTGKVTMRVEGSRAVLDRSWKNGSEKVEGTVAKGRPLQLEGTGHFFASPDKAWKVRATLTQRGERYEGTGVLESRDGARKFRDCTLALTLTGGADAAKSSAQLALPKQAATVKPVEAPARPAEKPVAETPPKPVAPETPQPVAAEPARVATAASPRPAESAAPTSPAPTALPSQTTPKPETAPPGTASQPSFGIGSLLAAGAIGAALMGALAFLLWRKSQRAASGATPHAEPVPRPSIPPAPSADPPTPSVMPSVTGSGSSRILKYGGGFLTVILGLGVLNAVWHGISGGSGGATKTPPPAATPKRTPERASTESPPGAPASIAPASPPDAPNARKAECTASTTILPLYCSVDHWDGDMPILGALDTNSFARERLAGLAHVLRNGSGNELETVYREANGACGVVLSRRGEYKGSTYSGVFYCDKTQMLTTPPPLRQPTKYPPGTNPLLGDWIEESSSTSSQGTRWSFTEEGIFVKKYPSDSSGKKDQYRLAGDVVAMKWDGEQWYLQLLISVSDSVIEMARASPSDKGWSGTRTVLRRVRGQGAASAPYVDPTVSAPGTAGGNQKTPSRPVASSAQASAAPRPANMTGNPPSRRPDARAAFTCTKPSDEPTAMAEAIVARQAAFAIIEAARQRGGACAALASGLGGSLRSSDQALNNALEVNRRGGRLSPMAWTAYCLQYSNFAERIRPECR